MSNVTAGGGTAFLDLNIVAEPEMGSAIFWYNLKENGVLEERVKHAACPIIEGKWLLEPPVQPPDHVTDFSHQSELRPNGPSNHMEAINGFRINGFTSLVKNLNAPVQQNKFRFK